MTSLSVLLSQVLTIVPTVSCSCQITEKLELLLTERESLYATWEDHKTELDQAYDLQVFLRDAKQIDTLTSTQEVKLPHQGRSWGVLGCP